MNKVVSLKSELMQSELYKRIFIEKDNSSNKTFINITDYPRKEVKNVINYLRNEDIYGEVVEFTQDYNDFLYIEWDKPFNEKELKRTTTMNIVALTITSVIFGTLILSIFMSWGYLFSMFK